MMTQSITTNNQQPTTNNQQPTTNNQQSTIKDGNAIYLLGELGKLTAYRTSDGGPVWSVDFVGALLWQHDRTAGQTKQERTTAHGNSPVFADGYVFEATSYQTRGGGAVALRPKGPGIEAEPVWENSQLSCEHGGYIAADGHIYTSAGTGWTCLDLKTGEERWAGRGPGKGSVIHADGMLYCLGENGKMALLEADPKSFKVAGMFELPAGDNPCRAHLAIADGKLYLRWDDNLYMYDIKE